ncbi:hypothetical protein TWF506_009736 [Arthrobotrys conoides]|uniref:Uncharacterized protein n=1 Tax=Arthrobotrys conoides TaxID=74498 RepID=A0AAN8NJ01_9PEZI
MEEDNGLIDLIPFPDVEEYRPNAGNAEVQNNGGIELIPVNGLHQYHEDDAGDIDIEAQTGSMNDDQLNNAFRGPLDRSY